MILKIFRDLILFALIFSFFNDNAMVDLLGASSLKAMFILFVVVYSPDIVKSAVKFVPNTVMKSFYFFIIIFSIIAMISVIFLNQIDLMKAIMVIMSMYIVFIFITYYKELDKLLYFIWINIVISAIISLFNDPISIDTFRRSGGTIDPVEFSGHLIIGMLITIYLFKKNRSYIFLIVPNLLFLYALLYAGSKTAILAIVLLLFYVLVVRFGYIFRYIFSVKGFVSLAIIFSVVVQADLFKKLDAIEGLQERAKTQGTAQQRFISWEAGYGMIQDHFFTGVGLEEYAHNTQKYLKDYLGVDGYDPHNIFIKILAEAGIFSFLSFLFFLFSLFKEKYSEILTSDYFWISLIPLSAVFMGISIGIAYEKHFWLSLALLSNVLLLHNNKKENE